MAKSNYISKFNMLSVVLVMFMTSACDDGGPMSGARPQPSCGNGVVDAGEQCDGGANCSTACLNLTQNPPNTGNMVKEMRYNCGTAGSYNRTYTRDATTGRLNNVSWNISSGSNPATTGSMSISYTDATHATVATTIGSASATQTWEFDSAGRRIRVTDSNYLNSGHAAVQTFDYPTFDANNAATSFPTGYHLFYDGDDSNSTVEETNTERLADAVLTYESGHLKTYTRSWWVGGAAPSSPQETLTLTYTGGYISSMGYTNTVTPNMNQNIAYTSPDIANNRLNSQTAAANGVTQTITYQYDASVTSKVNGFTLTSTAASGTTCTATYTYEAATVPSLPQLMTVPDPSRDSIEGWNVNFGFFLKDLMLLGL